LGHFETEGHINMCLNLTLLALFVGLQEQGSWQDEWGYKTRIARYHFEFYWQHKETWRSTQTNYRRSSHTICKVHWGRRWDFRTFIANKLFSVWQICYWNNELK
jgi:hypothetical protein